MTKTVSENTKMGRPRSKPEDITRQFAIRIKPGDLEALRELAKDEGTSLSSYIVDVLIVHLYGNKRH